MTHSPETIEKLRAIARARGPEHYLKRAATLLARGGGYKRDQVGYWGIHSRLARRKASECLSCQATTDLQSALLHEAESKVDHVGIPYSTREEDYVTLCRSCHTLYDRSGWELVEGVLVSPS